MNVARAEKVEGYIKLANKSTNIYKTTFIHIGKVISLNFDSFKLLTKNLMRASVGDINLKAHLWASRTIPPQADNESVELIVLQQGQELSDELSSGFVR